LSDDKLPGRYLNDIIDHVIGKPIVCGIVSEPDPIISTQATPCAQPHETPAILADTQYIIVYQSIFNTIGTDNDLLSMQAAQLPKNRQYNQDKFQRRHG
jgi:hypothetical protein